MKQQISILGCGWLGVPLAKIFIQNGYGVKGSTTSLNKLDKLKSVGITPFAVHLNNIKNNVSDFLLAEILIISIPDKNIDGFKQLIAEIEKSPIKKIVFISSTSVYSNLNKIVDENSPIKSTPLSKIELLFRNNSNFKTTIIRFGGLFGYDRKPANFIPLNKKMDNPEGYVNLIHRDDCIQIIKQIIFQDVWNKTFNACAETHPTRREFYMNEAKKSNCKNVAVNDNSINNYKIVSSNKLKEMLNFTFKHSNLLDTI